MPQLIEQLGETRRISGRSRDVMAAPQQHLDDSAEWCVTSGLAGRIRILGRSKGICLRRGVDDIDIDAVLGPLACGGSRQRANRLFRDIVRSGTRLAALSGQ